MIENGLEMVNHYIEHRLQRENQILSNLSHAKGKTIEELVEAIYVDLNPMLIPGMVTWFLVKIKSLWVSFETFTPNQIPVVISESCIN